MALAATSAPRKWRCRLRKRSGGGASTTSSKSGGIPRHCRTVRVPSGCSLRIDRVQTTGSRKRTARGYSGVPCRSVPDATLCFPICGTPASAVAGWRRKTKCARRRRRRRSRSTNHSRALSMARCARPVATHSQRPSTFDSSTSPSW